MFDDEDMTVEILGEKYPVVEFNWQGQSYEIDEFPLEEAEASGVPYGIVFEKSDGMFGCASVNMPETN